MTASVVMILVKKTERTMSNLEEGLGLTASGLRTREKKIKMNTILFFLVKKRCLEKVEIEH